jgi:hypothetical protein
MSMPARPRRLCPAIKGQYFAGVQKAVRGLPGRAGSVSRTDWVRPAIQPNLDLRDPIPQFTSDVDGSGRVGRLPTELRRRAETKISIHRSGDYGDPAIRSAPPR